MCDAGGDFEAFRKQARPLVAKVILNKITDILLYQQARKDAPDNIDETLDKFVETEVNKFIASYGGNYAKAQARLTKMGLDWQGLRPFASKKAGVFAGATEGVVTDSLKDCKLVGRVLIMRGIYRTPLLSCGFLAKT